MYSLPLKTNYTILSLATKAYTKSARGYHLPATVEIIKLRSLILMIFRLTVITRLEIHRLLRKKHTRPRFLV